MARDLKSLVFEKDWLEKYEKPLAKALVEAVQREVKRRGVEETLGLVLRADCVLVSYLMVRRVEWTLRSPQQDPDDGGSSRRKDSEGAQIEALGRAHERLRRAMKDLEEYCAKVGTPIDIGLADLMKPILRKGEGVLEASMEQEGAKPSETREAEE